MSKFKEYMEAAKCTGAGFGPGGAPQRGATTKSPQKYFCPSCGKKSKFYDDEIHNICPKCKGDQLEKDDE